MTMENAIFFLKTAAMILAVFYTLEALILAHTLFYYRDPKSIQSLLLRVEGATFDNYSCWRKLISNIFLIAILISFIIIL
jgi:hypothetical protein